MGLIGYKYRFTTIAFILLLTGSRIFAAGPYFSNGGNWGTAGTWLITSCAGGGGAVPTNADDVTICTGTVNINVSGTCRNLTISNGATLTFNTNGANLVVTGTLTVNGGVTGGKITYSANTSYTGTGTTCQLQVSGNLSCTSPGSINMSKTPFKYGEIVFNTGTNSVVSGNGAITAYSITVGKTVSTATVDITATAFTAGNSISLILNKGTFIWDNPQTLSDCYDDNVTTGLTVKSGVVLECANGLMHICKNGQLTLNQGELYIHGGHAYVGESVEGTDIIYNSLGASVPEILIDAAGAILDVYGGINDNGAYTNAMNFQMSAGTLNLSVGPAGAGPK